MANSNMDILGEIILAATFELRDESAIVKQMGYRVSDRMIPFVALIVTWRANEAADKLYKNNGLVDGDGDAFRHGYWSALLADTFGLEKSKEITTEYENQTGNGDKSSEMDFANNRIGRELVENKTFNSIDHIEQIVQDAVETGKFLKINTNPFMPTGS